MEDQRVLIVEDCYPMTDAIRDVLTAAGTTSWMIEALQIDLACVDPNLGCETSLPMNVPWHPDRVRHRL